MSPRLVGVAVLALCCCFASGCEKRSGETPAAETEAIASVADAPAKPQFRNPFGLEQDITDCCSPALDEWAEGAPEYGGDDDENAEQWTDFGEQPSYDSIEGEWRSRWNPDQWWNEGYATIRTVDDRVWIYYRDDPDVLGPQNYLIESRREGNRLLGRWEIVGFPGDWGYWAGTVVDNERIDGLYTGPYRWDFRRAKRKEAEGPTD